MAKNAKTEIENQEVILPETPKKVQVQSIVGATIMHNGLTIYAGEILLLEKEVAEVLIAKKFCREVTVRGI